MRFTRRSFLLILALLALGDYGRSVWIRNAGTPQGWRTERWQAGFGSWARGGYGVAYDISLPQDYDFTQKCGRAWISDDVDGPDFDIRFSYMPDAKERQEDFALYKKEDLARDYENGASAVKIDAPSPLMVGPIRFDRTEMTLEGARARDETATPAGPAKGFWLSGESMSIISDLRDAAGAATNERIAASVRRAYGFGLTELFFGTIPGLLGC